MDRASEASRCVGVGVGARACVWCGCGCARACMYECAHTDTRAHACASVLCYAFVHRWIGEDVVLSNMDSRIANGIVSEDRSEFARSFGPF
jgi:hypothetical protein